MSVRGCGGGGTPSHVACAPPRRAAEAQTGGAPLSEAERHGNTTLPREQRGGRGQPACLASLYLLWAPHAAAAGARLSAEARMARRATRGVARGKGPASGLVLVG